MRLEQFEYLLAIHETHSISLASQNLHVSQQNISKAIQNLESELETTLLQRSNRGTYLTAAGLVVLKHAQKIFYELRALQSELHATQEQNSSLKGTLSIVYTNVFNHNLITNSVHAFIKDFPLVNVQLYQKSLAKVLLSIHNQEADIGFITAHDDFHLNGVIDKEKLQSIALYPLAEDTLLGAVGHTSPLAAQKSITLGKLLKNRLLFLTHESSDILEDNWLYQLLAHYATPQLTMTTNSLDLYLKAIVDNIGVGFFIQSAQKRFPAWCQKNAVLLPIRPTISLIHSYVLNSYQPISAVTAAYLPYLSEQNMLDNAL